ncbi:DUF4221 family protein [Flavobacterium sp. J27]|uniref:DUF4221 family protein n=1 Tax=Flavobacterium sp. J27 TaxID=2060419 RepID=UPI0010327370|nr:DUF4221 family protein [Flavobacterium sp. J27]
MKRNLFLTLLFLLLLSCSEKKKYNFMLVKSDSISIPIDETISQITGCLEYTLYDNKPTLLYSNRDIENNVAEILFFDLNEKKIYKKLSFSEDKGFYKSTNGFKFINKDSIIVSNVRTDTLYITDFYEKIKFKKHFKFQGENYYISQVTSMNSHPIVKYKSNLYVTPMLFTENQKEFINKPFLFEYNFKTDSLKPLNVYFPKEYIASDYFSFELSHYFDGKNVIFSPMNSHKIWIVNLETKKMRIVEAKSDYCREFLKFKDSPQKTMIDGMYNNAYYSQYISIIYDKYRKVYYRLFYQGIDIDKNDKNLSNEYDYPKVMSIITLDENFNKIAEDIFPNHDFMSMYFITPDGLYMNSDNVLNQNYDEDKLTFTKLVLQNEEN